jgi:flagellar assembly protein FliH
MTTPHKKFGFDTVFDNAGRVAYAPPQAKRVYTPPEVEEIRAAAYAEGERSALAKAAEVQARAMNEIAGATRAALAALTEVVHRHRADSSELALAAAKVVAGAALDLFPGAPVAAALEGLAREVEAAPRLVVRAAPELEAATQALLDETAQACGYPGQISVKTDASLPRAGFVIDWGDGRASFDPVQAQARVADALHTALAAEGLHAESPFPT